MQTRTLDFFASKLAAVASYAMGSSPGTGMMGHQHHQMALDASSDADAEGEYDDEVTVQQVTGRSAHTTVEPEDSEADAEGSDDDAEGEEDIPVATVDFAHEKTEDDDAEGEDEVAAETASDAESEAASADASSESEAENEWEGGSDTAEDVEVEAAERNHCM